MTHTHVTAPTQFVEAIRFSWHTHHVRVREAFAFLAQCCGHAVEGVWGYDGLMPWRTLCGPGAARRQAGSRCRR
jgi:hypothetical protein